MSMSMIMSNKYLHRRAWRLSTACQVVAEHVHETPKRCRGRAAPAACRIVHYCRISCCASKLRLSRAFMGTSTRRGHSRSSFVHVYSGMLGAGPRGTAVLVCMIGYFAEMRCDTRGRYSCRTPQGQYQGLKLYQSFEARPCEQPHSSFATPPLSRLVPQHRTAKMAICSQLSNQLSSQRHMIT